MNKSPPASGGLFYFGQVAVHEVKFGIGSSYMRKVGRFLNSWKPEKRLPTSEPESGNWVDLHPAIKNGRLAQTILADGKKELFICQ